jgi:hypothetical protein
MTVPPDTIGTSVTAGDTTTMSKDLAAPAYLSARGQGLPFDPTNRGGEEAGDKRLKS